MKLIQYKGGGYEGCYWEWNFCIVDDEKNPTVFENVLSSGRHGVRSIEDFGTIDGERFVYDLGSKEDWEDFDSNANPVHVFHVAEWIETNLPEFHHHPKCDECGNDITDAEEAGFEDYHGEGGLSYAPHRKVCSVCKADHMYRTAVEIVRDNWDGDWPYSEEEEVPVLIAALEWTSSDVYEDSDGCVEFDKLDAVEEALRDRSSELLYRAFGRDDQLTLF